MTPGERYRRVLRAPHVATLYASSVVARLPVGANGLAIVLFMRERTGSFAAAGAAAGAYALASGISSPWQGRLIDRHGPRLIIPRLVALQVAGVLAFVGLGLTGAPVGVLVLTAFAAGLGQAPFSSVMRAMWPRLLADPALIATAFALDSAVVEIVFVVGPLLTALLTAVFSPQLALLVSVAFATLGALPFIRSPAIRTWEPEPPSDSHILGALRSPGLRTVVLTTLPIGFAFGSIEIAVPAFAAHHDHANAAGLLLAAWALGSASGGLVFGARDWPWALSRQYVVLVGILALSFLPLLAAASLTAIVPLLLVAGAFIAPTISAGSQLMGRLAPPGMGTEAYAWGPTAIVAGFAAGSALCGALAEAQGWRAALVAGLVVVGAATAYVVLARATLDEPAPLV